MKMQMSKDIIFALMMLFKNLGVNFITILPFMTPKCVSG